MKIFALDQNLTWGIQAHDIPGANSVARAAFVEGQFLLATLPPSKRQVRLALGITLALVVGVLAVAPFAHTPLPQPPAAFYPILLTVTIINDLVTSALLFSQFYVAGQTALFVLANAYLFSGLMTIPFMLTFPGSFSSSGLLGAGLQSANYISIFYRVGASFGLIAYALLRNAGRGTRMSQRSPLVVISGSVAAVIAIVCGLTWFATAEETLLPVIYVDSSHPNGIARAVQSIVVMSLIALALALLWTWLRSALDLWLTVMCSTWLLSQFTSNILSNARFSLGWYAARGYEVSATLVVLLVLLSETTALYAKLGRSLSGERRAREAREAAMEAMVATIAHELRQPLTAIATDASAGLRFMARSDLDEARTSFESVVSNAHHASGAIEGLRALFKKDIHKRALLDINEVVRHVLATIDVNLRQQRVSVSAELHGKLPQVLASRVQLEQVFLNLIMNAIQAMHAVTDRARLLHISSDTILGSSNVLVAIEDTGPGIDSENKERIFKPFFTTKSEGMGIGLFICRAIVESHGGNIQASANNPHGMVFRVELPIGGSQ